MKDKTLIITVEMLREMLKQAEGNIGVAVTVRVTTADEPMRVIASQPYSLE